MWIIIVFVHLDIMITILKTLNVKHVISNVNLVIQNIFVKVINSITFKYIKILEITIKFL